MWSRALLREESFPLSQGHHRWQQGQLVPVAQHVVPICGTALPHHWGVFGRISQPCLIVPTAAPPTGPCTAHPFALGAEDFIKFSHQYVPNVCTILLSIAKCAASLCCQAKKKVFDFSLSLWIMQECPSISTPSSKGLR